MRGGLATQGQQENPSQESGYLAFLIRLWKDRAGSPWRASIENPHTGERASFAELPLLFEYLQDRTSGSSDPAVPTRPKGDRTGESTGEG